MFFRREIRDDRWLQAKMVLFTIGALLAVAGMALQVEWLVTVAALVLATGLAIRFLPDRSDQEDVDEDEPSA